MTTFPSSFIAWISLITAVFCSFATRPSDQLDRLLVYHRFQEAKELLASATDDLDQFCTAQVITRCIDLRNYKVRIGNDLLKRLPPTDSFSIALQSGSVTFDQENVVQEANDIFETLFPAVIHKKSVLTRAFNSAVFHSDYNLMERFIEMDQNLFGSDDEGLTPLMTAIKFHRKVPLQWLLLKGANIHYVNSRGENLLHILARTALNDKIINSIVAGLIIDEGLDWKLVNNQGFNPLDVAVAKENYETIDLIMMTQQQGYKEEHK